jgi:ubiquinone/menaquinone biosynthesis C-methylase UbiE
MVGDWRGYDSVAADYRRVLEPRTALAAGDLVDLIGIPPGARVLDVGTGTGVAARAAAAVAGEGGLVVGIDPAPAMLAEAVGRGAPTSPRYAAAEAIDLPFRDGAFGYVTACFVLSHFTRYETALFDMMRVLARGGRMGVASWGPGLDAFSSAWDSVAEEFAEREMLQDARARAMPWHDHFADQGRTRDRLHEAGLREIRLETREYHFKTTIDDYLDGREATATGRFLREMVGEEIWKRFRGRVREVFHERFPERFNDFRDVVMAVGTKPR